MSESIGFSFLVLVVGKGTTVFREEPSPVPSPPDLLFGKPEILRFFASLRIREHLLLRSRGSPVLSIAVDLEGEKEVNRRAVVPGSEVIVLKMKAKE